MGSQFLPLKEIFFLPNKRISAMHRVEIIKRCARITVGLGAPARASLVSRKPKPQMMLPAEAQSSAFRFWFLITVTPKRFFYIIDPLGENVNG